MELNFHKKQFDKYLLTKRIPLLSSIEPHFGLEFIDNNEKDNPV